jgi:GNAT superfamily N-acetyltransferase
MCRLNLDWNIGIEEENWSDAVVRLEPSQAEGLAGVLTRAFYEEPNFKYMIPDEQARLSHLPEFFRVAIRASQLCGEIYTTQTVDGGALWICPERALTPWRMAWTGFPSMPFSLGWANYSRWFELGTRLEEVRDRVAKEPHWYLMALGVEPAKQRRRIGARLIQPILSRADSERLLCYLETFNEKNLPFYKRHGFRIAAAGNVPDGPDFWAMIRTPQTL